MYDIGPFPPASLLGTWSENVEIWSIDDDTLMDLTGVTEIILKLRDPRTCFDELVLTMSGGNIIVPAPGIIQWRAEVGQMGALEPKVYEVIILLENATDTVPLTGSVAVVQ
jgi:hypothetical protein